MANTYIDTSRLPRTKIARGGEASQILNNHLGGAKNVSPRCTGCSAVITSMAGEPNVHHLLYLMAGEATVTLNGGEHGVDKGAGVYLGPSETARISHAGDASLKLFHLTVPKL